MKNFSKFAIILIIAALFVPVLVLAQNYTPESGLEATAGAAGLSEKANFPVLIGQVLFAVISFIGVIFLVLLVYGGFLWMTAGGNAPQTQKAGAIMRNGAIGIVIILASYAIVYFVLNTILSNTSSSGSTSSTQNCTSIIGQTCETVQCSTFSNRVPGTGTCSSSAPYCCRSN